MSTYSDDRGYLVAKYHLTEVQDLINFDYFRETSATKQLNFQLFVAGTKVGSSDVTIILACTQGGGQSLMWRGERGLSPVFSRACPD